MLPAGKRNRRIVFETAPAVVDPENGSHSYADWSAYFTCWAERRDLSGNELLRAQALVAKVTTSYRIPYPHGKNVTPREALRIVDQGRVYDVTYVGELGVRGREGLEILAFARAEQDTAAA